MDYQQDMHIDEDALDLEWLEQPSLMLKYSTKYAEAKQERDLSKESLDLVMAELDKAVREDPEEFGLAKITETAVRNVILTLDEYKKATQDYLNKKYEADVLGGVISAVEMRKAALENLVKLNGQQYFAGPSVPRDITEERKLHNKQTSARIAQRMKRSK